MSGVNAANAANAGMWGGLMGMGAAGIGKYSDRRTKENIHKIGRREDGLNIYVFDYKPEFKSSGEGQQVGLMADEVELIYPDAVAMGAGGYKMVNYDMLGWTNGR